MKFNFTAIAPSLGVLALLTAAPNAAFAQDAADDSEEEIVVTGTSIRGVAATGSQTIALDAEAITEVGANSTNELLSSIPQIGQFNSRWEQDPRGAFQDSINRPNLRNLPGFNSASGSVTLIIVDGHRVTPLGVGESAIDPDILPAAVMQRVEVVTDGGSSIYGADAVAGVINFVTRREFDGVQVDANYGMGDTISGFNQWDATLTAGTSWANGNGYISIGTSERDAILNGETSWARQGVWQPDGSLRPVGTQCRSPVGTVDRYVWLNIFGGIWTNNPLAGGGQRAVGSPCDIFAENTYLAGQTRDNLFASLTQHLSDNIELHVTGYYTSRDTNMPSYPAGFTAAQASAPPPFRGDVPGNPTVVDVPLGTGFSFGVNSAYVDHDFEQAFDTWGITPELTIDLGADWQVRGTLHYGRSENTSRNPVVNATLARAAITAGTLVPNNVAAASATTIQNILNWVDAQDTNQELLDIRAIADGPLLQLPAGPLRVALGVEFANSSAETRALTGTFGAIDSVAFRDADRDQVSVFAEANVPVIDALDLSFAVRYDDYSDFGATTNPTLGFDLHPVDGLRIFGHWGTSFNAPTVIDAFAIATGRAIQNLPAVVIQGNDILGEWDGVGTDVLQLTGSSGDLDPQEAEQWALGGEFEPMDGLRLGLNYYEIDFTNILGAVNPQDPAQHIAHPEKFIWNPTQAEWDAFLAGLNNAGDLAALSPTTFAFILDRITDNLDSARLTGLDFSASYSFDTALGAFDIGLSGNNQISFELNGVDALANNVPDLTWVGTLGWQGEHLSTRFTLNHTGGFDTNTTQGRQSEVSSYTTADLFVGYDLGAFGAEGSSLRLAVDNLFDEEPPIWRQNDPSLGWSGYSLGRVLKVGLTAHF